MELICPNCREVVVAFTRRLECSHCSTPIDAWQILMGIRPVQKPSSIPDLGSEDSRREPSAASEPSKPGNIDNILEIPPLPAARHVTENSPPVLELGFGNARTYRQVKEISGSIPVDRFSTSSPQEFDSKAGLSPSEEPQRRSRSAALLAVIGGLALGAVALFYLFGRGPAPSIFRADSEVTASPAAGGLPPGAPGTATETPAQATPDPDAAATPLLNPSPSPTLGTPSPAPTTTPRPTPTPSSDAAGATADTVAPAPNPPGTQDGTLSTRARTVTAPEGSNGAFTLQVAARRKEADARQIAERLIERGIDARLVTTGTDGNYWHNVRVGSFTTRLAAESYAEQLKRSGAIAEYFVTDKRQ